MCDNKEREKRLFPTVFLTQIKLIDLDQATQKKGNGYGIYGIESFHTRNLKPIENFLAFNPYLCNAYPQYLGYESKKTLHRHTYNASRMVSAKRCSVDMAARQN